MAQTLICAFLFAVLRIFEAMAAYYLYFKSLHIIFVVTWFAGLFYMPRLFVYQIEASQKSSPDKEILGKQLGLMAHRLWKIITGPSMVLTVVFGSLMFYVQPALFRAPWMHIKLGFIGLLFLYHWKTWRIHKSLQKGFFTYSSKQMRFWNEGATLILFAVVFLAVTKNTTNWLFGLGGLLGLAVLLMLGIKLYKKIQDNNPNA